MVLDKIWEKAGYPQDAGGWICRECLEKDLGRPLDYPDFSLCLLTIDHLLERGAISKEYSLLLFKVVMAEFYVRTCNEEYYLIPLLVENT